MYISLEIERSFRCTTFSLGNFGYINEKVISCVMLVIAEMDHTDEDLIYEKFGIFMK